MNPDKKPTPPEKPQSEGAKDLDLDDDLEEESLGERQPEACDAEEGCEVCQ